MRKNHSLNNLKEIKKPHLGKSERNKIMKPSSVSIDYREVSVLIARSLNIDLNNININKKRRVIHLIHVRSRSDYYWRLTLTKQ